MANRPYILIKKKHENTCLPIDVAIPADRTVTSKEVKTKLKYTSFFYGGATTVEHEMCLVIPVIIGATGTVAKGFQKSLEAIPR